MKSWRGLCVIVLVVAACSAYPLTNHAQASEHAHNDPNSVVPSEFAGDMDWSEQGDWHWVIYSYVGDNVTSGAVIEPPYFVATLVRTLDADDPCDDCVDLGDGEQGPPIVKGGPDDPHLAGAYENLSNGPRYKLADDPTHEDDEDEEGQSSLWAAGAWYLNYNPASDRFTSWTWIPDPNQTMATAMGASSQEIEFEPRYLGEFSDFLPDGTRVFPLAPGTYRMTQPFGCVAHNHGYATSSSCPPDRPSFHNGTDFGAPEGTTIYASASGTVTFADIDPSNSSGNSVIRIDHDGKNDAYVTEYLHWIRSYVSVGDYVYAGQPIAEVGSVGYSTGPHLHFTVIDTVSGSHVDPMIWLQSSVAPLGAMIAPDSELVRNVLRWEPMIRASGDRHNVPAALIAAVMTVESSGNPNVVSPAGAQGLMQVMPMHLTRYGISEDLWLDPATNIDAGARYLAESLSIGASLHETVARYFGFGCDVFGTCTEGYVARVLSWYAYYTAFFAGDPLPPIVAPAPVTSAPPSQEEPAPSEEPEVPEEPAPTTETDEATDEGVETDDEPAPEQEPKEELGPEETPEADPTEEPSAEEHHEGTTEAESTEEPSSDEHQEQTSEPEPTEEPSNESDQGDGASENANEQPAEELTPATEPSNGQDGSSTDESTDESSSEQQSSMQSLDEPADVPTSAPAPSDDDGDTEVTPEPNDSSTLQQLHAVERQLKDDSEDDASEGDSDGSDSDEDEVSYPIPQLING